MILTCPACGTSYTVKDGAIPAEGRQVRCASCRHSWFQRPEGTEQPASPLPTAEPAPVPETLRAAAATAEADSDAPAQPVEEQALSPALGAMVAADPVFREPPEEAEEAVDRLLPGDVEERAHPPAVDVFDFHEREEPRGRRAIWPLLIALLVAAALAAWFLAPPAWRSKVGFGAAEQTPLLLQVRSSDRQQLASGNELFAVSGRVINPTDQPQAVPPLRAELRDGAGKLIHGWTIAAPARLLPPGASASFNSAEVNVPEGAERLTVTLGPPAG